MKKLILSLILFAGTSPCFAIDASEPGGGGGTGDFSNPATETLDMNNFAVVDASQVAINNSNPPADTAFIVGGSSIIVKYDGNVGIGTASPSSKLHVYGGGVFGARVRDDGNISGLLVDVGAGSNQRSNLFLGVGGSSQAAMGWAATTSGNRLTIYVGSTEAVTISQADGKFVGIGLSAPAYKLDVNGGGHFTSSITVDGGSSFQAATMTAITVNGPVILTLNVQIGTNGFTIGGSSNPVISSTQSKMIWEMNGSSVIVASYPAVYVGTPTSGNLPPALRGFAGIYSTYSAAGVTELTALDDVANRTTLSSHDEDGNWIYKSFNLLTGKSVYINMEEMVGDIEAALGKRYKFRNKEEYVHDRKRRWWKPWSW